MVKPNGFGLSTVQEPAFVARTLMFDVKQRQRQSHASVALVVDMSVFFLGDKFARPLRRHLIPSPISWYLTVCIS